VFAFVKNDRSWESGAASGKARLGNQLLHFARVQSAFVNGAWRVAAALLLFTLEHHQMTGVPVAQFSARIVDHLSTFSGQKISGRFKSHYCYRALVVHGHQVDAFFHGIDRLRR
jgi:hypothetical protein